MREDKIRGGFAVARERDCDEAADEQGYSGAGGCSVGVGEVGKAADGPQVSEHQPNSVHWAMTKVECTTLWGSLSRLKMRWGRRGRSDHLSQYNVTCQNAV